MKLEALKAIHPEIDWDKKCQDYERCFQCPIGQRRTQEKDFIAYCDIVHNKDRQPFKDIYEDVIEAMKEFSS